ncbi:molybdenum cofactor cytidylyltransferase [Catalinimonas alkaloidigena]|uniref:Molybdenum cofactor cytidylyltransferase n=1 Tax=Catalinimonas alkaloidigena TaxID=1075417 RepID=A0A1G9BBA5_9BACT|nr:nucleotidyltransferase family protein [Catalinimonas alkaloidigena]SDK36846.1 molybdenum cofactor cytidylyltransferase [Catalinimonas alkaloidigena]
MPKRKSTVGGIILAAGNSSRMGEPKQLLPFGELNFLQHAVSIGTEAGLEPLVVVLGANASKMRRELLKYPVQMVINRDWQTGMGSSIQVGIKALRQLAPTLKAAAIMLCDQPLIDAAYIKQLVAAYKKSPKEIVASRYSGEPNGRTIGAPALFSCELFDELEQLSGDEGARHIIRNHLTDVELLDCPHGLLDVDTPEAYSQLMQQTQAAV